MREKIIRWISHRLSRDLVYFAAIRLMAEVTTGKYSNRTPTEVNLIEALKAWDEREA